MPATGSRMVGISNSSRMVRRISAVAGRRPTDSLLIPSSARLWPVSPATMMARVRREDLPRRLPRLHPLCGFVDASYGADLYRHKRGRGRSREGAVKQATKLRSIHNRPEVV